MNVCTTLNMDFLWCISGGESQSKHSESNSTLDIHIILQIEYTEISPLQNNKNILKIIPN